MMYRDESSSGPTTPSSTERGQAERAKCGTILSENIATLNHVYPHHPELGQSFVTLIVLFMLLAEAFYRMGSVVVSIFIFTIMTVVILAGCVGHRVSTRRRSLAAGPAPTVLALPRAPTRHRLRGYKNMGVATERVFV